MRRFKFTVGLLSALLYLGLMLLPLFGALADPYFINPGARAESFS